MDARPNIWQDYVTIFNYWLPYLNVFWDWNGIIKSNSRKDKIHGISSEICKRLVHFCLTFEWQSCKARHSSDTEVTEGLNNIHIIKIEITELCFFLNK